MALTTRSDLRVEATVNFPDESLVPAITVGDTRTPSFAIVAKILVACIAVTAYPCPKATVGAVVPDQSFTGRNRPLDSPGSPEPVDTPIPNLVKYSCNLSFERVSPILIVPVFEETARIPAVVKR